MTEYKPDNWIIVKIDNDDETIYKVLAGWSGGYLDGDSWKMNSGIVHIVDAGEYYEIHGYSGSVYICQKTAETLRHNNLHVWNRLEKDYPDKVAIVNIETVLDMFLKRP